jgi:glyoxylase-like metal-dependent hydrolase (beta-lactamase superfamily II)
MEQNALKIIPLNRYDIFASNSYLLILNDAIAVIDPSVGYGDAVRIYPEIADKSKKTILLTHGHMDHFYEIYTYVNNGFEVVVSEEDGRILADRTKNCAFMLQSDISGYDGAVKTVFDGDIIELGEARIEVIATPGHTIGSVCYRIGNDIFTGDTLFADGGYGRFDLPTGNRILLKSSLERLLSLDGGCRIYPGHGAVCTIEETKAFFI